MQDQNVPEQQPHHGPAFVNPFHHQPQNSVSPAPVAHHEATNTSPLTLTQPGNGQSVPVVRVLSVRGLEYALMTFMVWFGAASLIIMLLTLVNGQAGFEVLAFPLATLLVTLPVFGFLFVRLRKAELLDPSLRHETSKRRFSQITQLLAFFTSFFNIVAFVYQLISKAGGSEVEIGKAFLNMLVIVVITGGLFAYYWFDEHRTLKG